VRGAKKTEEGGGRTEENTASVCQMRSEIRELKAKAKDQDEVINMLKGALIACMSRSMHEAYIPHAEFEMRNNGYGSIEEMPKWRKNDCMTTAKQEVIISVAEDMFYLTHPGGEKHYPPSKLAVEAFGDIVGYNEYTYEAMAEEQKRFLWEEEPQSMFHRRLFAQCRELDWKKALEEDRDFHDYRKCVMDSTRHYMTEKCILLGDEDLPLGHEGYVIPKFP